MSEMEKDMEISALVEKYKTGEWDKELVERELLMLGLDRFEVQSALGQVLLSGFSGAIH